MPRFLEGTVVSWQRLPARAAAEGRGRDPERWRGDARQWGCSGWREVSGRTPLTSSLPPNLLLHPPGCQLGRSHEGEQSGRSPKHRHLISEISDWFRTPLPPRAVRRGPGQTLLCSPWPPQPPAPAIPEPGKSFWAGSAAAHRTESAAWACPRPLP